MNELSNEKTRGRTLCDFPRNRDFTERPTERDAAGAFFYSKNDPGRKEGCIHSG
jgi:hypothetical protein